MLAVKHRRASEYVPQSLPQPRGVVVALAGDAHGDAESPARALQAELAARLAGAPVVRNGRSLRWRAAMIFGAAILCWVPIAAAAALIFG
jgi:hypothetical protein